MKTHQIPSRAMCAAAALLAVSCNLPGIPSGATPATPVVRSHWVKVSSRPPTYYPRGVPTDHPTDHWSGEWVHTDDAQGTRYFIPLHNRSGIPRQTLIAEALSELSDRKLARIAAEDREIRERNVKNAIVYGPLAVAGLTFTVAGGGNNAGGWDLHHMQKEWDTARHPESTEITDRKF